MENMEGVLANKFVKMGDITGIHVDDIIKRVGRPQSISVASGGSLYQWIKTGGLLTRGYHYAILVDADGKALYYTHQFSR